MTSYAPVAVTGIAIRGPHHHQQAPGADGFNGNGGVRTEWWWQAGPVDSCCCCCSLRTGVGLLAVDGLLSGIWAVFFSRAFYASGIKTSLQELQDQYARNCEGAAASTPHCEQLKESIGQTEGILNVFLNLPMIVYVQGGLAVAAGVVGLWAVFFQSKQAAKVYMLSWPAKFLLAVWGALEMRSLNIKYDVQQGHIGIVYLITFIILLYYFKVSWSYYKKRLDHEKAHTNSSSSSSGGGSTSASSDTAYHATPTLAMNTNV